MSLPGRLIETAAGRVFVHQDGDGPPLVLLHGLFVSHWYFRGVIETLRRHRRVIALDLPGHGESDSPPPSRYGYDATAAAEVVAEVMDAVGAPAAELWGHSAGAGIGVVLAARQPERVRRLVVENGWVYPIHMPLAGRLALQPLVGDMIFRNLYGRRDLARHFRSVFCDPSLATEEMIDYFWERMNRAGARDALLASLRAFGATPDNTADPARVRCPTLVVWGEADQMFPLAHGQRLVRQVPGAKLVVLPACAHSPHEEHPEEVLRVVLPFLDGQDVGEAAGEDDAAAAAQAGGEAAGSQTVGGQEAGAE